MTLRNRVCSTAKKFERPLIVAATVARVCYVIWRVEDMH
jgi:hypothetical protein